MQLWQGGCVLQSNCHHMQRSHCHCFILFQTGADFKLQLNSVCHQVTISLRAFSFQSSFEVFLEEELDQQFTLLLQQFWETPLWLVFKVEDWRTRKLGHFPGNKFGWIWIRIIWFENPPTKHKTKIQIFAVKNVIDLTIRINLHLCEHHTVSQNGCQ